MLQIAERHMPLRNSLLEVLNMTTRIRKKKPSLTEMKIAVIGAHDVGKTALIVRFITKRYIGEYSHDAENRYKHEASVDGEPVLFEIRDTCRKNENETPNASELSQWADGLLLVYSVTDRHSFNFIRSVKSDLQTDTPVQLVANKNELVHLRQVSTDEGEILAQDFECKFCEVSAAEHVDLVAEVFYDICKEVLSSKRKPKQTLLERMLGGHRPYSRGKSDGALSKDLKPYE